MRDDFPLEDLPFPFNKAPLDKKNRKHIISQMHINIYSKITKFTNNFKYKEKRPFLSIGNERIILLNILLQKISSGRGHMNNILDIIQLSNGYLVTGGGDECITFWNISYREERSISVIEGLHQNAILCFCELDLGYIASGGMDKNIYIHNIYEISKPKLLGKLTGHKHWVKALLYTGKGQLVSGGYDECIMIWDSYNLLLIKHIKYENFGSIYCLLTLTPRRFVSVSYSCNNCLVIWKTQKLEQFKKCSGGVNDNLLCASRVDRERVIAGSTQGVLSLWNLRNNKKIREYKLFKNWINTLLLIRGDVLFAAGDDAILKVIFLGAETSKGITLKYRKYGGINKICKLI